MRIVLITGTPFGRFYFDPETHSGIACSDDGMEPVKITMKPEWDPYADPRNKQLDVNPIAYGKLIEAAEKGDRNAFDDTVVEYRLY